jgi:hypothetical protein
MNCTNIISSALSATAKLPPPPRHRCRATTKLPLPSRSVLQEQRWNNQGQAVQVWKVQENIFLFSRENIFLLSRENIFLFSISRASEKTYPLPGTRENPGRRR